LAGGAPQPFALFHRVAILGLGLIGGSLGLALLADGLAEAVVGYDTTPAHAEEALARGLVGASAATPADAVADADLVVFAVPVLAIQSLMRAVAPALAPDAILTDVGSVKAPVVAWAEATLPQPERFVGGHPMAGRERSGPGAAEAVMFRGARWPLTPTPATQPAALARIQALVVALGGEPLVMAPDEHDRLVAGASHLPLLAATALTQTLAASPDWPGVAQLAAGGFRDTTRVAAGDPTMARDICLTNRAPILARLDAYLDTLHQLRAALDVQDGPALATIFAAAKAAREQAR
jgi:prephenate dehydrogenase